MSIWYTAPDPATRLGRHRQLAPLAGIHVSPIALGAMSIGDKWAELGMGAMDKESSFQLLNAYYEAGGNFIDTANDYQDESSEMFIGEWMEHRGVREQIVLATKYSAAWKRRTPSSELSQKTHYVGNNVKSLRLSVEASLKKLRTTYIDILYVHWWDYTTSIEEVMDGLHHLVTQGKVLYLGVSDAPAWVVSKANQYARMSGKTPFVIYQGAWSVMQRDIERDILPMILNEGMALAPWNVLAAGKIRTDAEEAKRVETGEESRKVLSDWKRNEEQCKVSSAIEKVAQEVGAKSITSVAIAYVMQKAPYVFPVIGGRKVEHLLDNLEALSIALTLEQIDYLDSVVPFQKGFPHYLLGSPSENSIHFKNAGHFDKWPPPQAIRPSPY